MKALLRFAARLARALVLLFCNPRPATDPGLWKWATENGTGTEPATLFS